MARSRGLPSCGGQRRPWTLPPPLIVRRRHSDEGRRSVWRRRAGVRAGLRRVPGGAGPARRQRPPLFDGPSAGGSAVRSVRDVPRWLLAARSAARRIAPSRAADMGGGVGERSQAAAPGNRGVALNVVASWPYNGLFLRRSAWLTSQLEWTS